jgi:hypothetical protein
MNRVRRILVVAIVGMAILGLGFITAARADKPPKANGFPDATPLYVEWDGNEIHQSEASYLITGWVYWVEEGYDETKLYPHPIDAHLWIGDVEIDLQRYAVGHGNLDSLVPPEWLPYLKGPFFGWFAYFEPYYFDVGQYDIHTTLSFKNPDSPSGDRIYFDYWGLVTVLPG